MKETYEGYARLSGVDIKTFERFLEYIYKGYYAAPQPKMEVRSLVPGTKLRWKADETTDG